MALRASEQPIAGLSFYWQNATEQPILEWNQWISLFEVALMAKFSISVGEITTEDATKRTALMGGPRSRSGREESR